MTMTTTRPLDPQKVWDAIQAIPAGQTASYGQVALRAGYPGRARWVASLLSSQSGPKGLPWHRVVRADGRIAFEPGSKAFGEQSQRLRADGVQVIDGKVQVHGRRNLDEALWR